MSDQVLAFVVTVGIMAALALWVPVLDRVQHFISNHVIRRQKD